MVQRTTNEYPDEFKGKVENVVIEPSSFDATEQYHITMIPDDKDIVKGSATGMFHEWIRISAKSKPNMIPEGSVLDKYILELEMLDSSVKKKETHLEAMQSIKGKHYLFKKKVLGKSFQGHEARSYWIPVREL